MIFPQLKNEAIVQVGDKTRLDASVTFSNEETITQIEIDPDNSGNFYDVTELKYLDIVYTVAGVKTIVVRVNGTETKEFSINIISTIDDNLFSNDSDIQAYESDLLKWVQDGRNSFLDKHRLAQYEILNELDASAVWKKDGTRYEASDIVDIQEFKEWSKFATLRIIFEGLSNEVGDIFSLKAQKYSTMQSRATKRAVLRLSPNGTDETEKRTIFSGDLVRA